MVDQDSTNRRIERRKKNFVDREIQTALLRQIALNWLMVFGVIAAFLLAVESYKGGYSLSFTECIAAMWNHNAALIIAIIGLGPVIVWDCIRQSHRFVGPMVSFRRAMQRLGDGETVDPVCFRKNDHWHDIADSFNRVLERINRLEAARGTDAATPIVVDTSISTAAPTTELTP